MLQENGMLVQKYRLRTIAENIANVSTHMTDRGEPYRKKYVVVVPDKMENPSCGNYGV